MCTGCFACIHKSIVLLQSCQQKVCSFSWFVATIWLSLHDPDVGNLLSLHGNISVLSMHAELCSHNFLLCTWTAMSSRSMPTCNLTLYYALCSTASCNCLCFVGVDSCRGALNKRHTVCSAEKANGGQVRYAFLSVGLVQHAPQHQGFVTFYCTVMTLQISGLSCRELQV